VAWLGGAQQLDRDLIAGRSAMWNAGPPAGRVSGLVNDVNEKSVGEHISELRNLVLAYVRQEIFGPLRGAGRLVKLGLLGGAIAIAAALIAGVGLLRLGQTATALGIDHGSWSWLVYLVIGLACVLAGAAFVVLGARPRSKS
jgi:hypothetical protein